MKSDLEALKGKPKGTQGRKVALFVWLSRLRLRRVLILFTTVFLLLQYWINYQLFFKIITLGLIRVPPKQKAQCNEVADLVLDIYKTLAEMRYVDLEYLQLGPHDLNSLRPVYKKQGLDPAIVYLYSILPYFDPEMEYEKPGIFRTGDSVDFRNEDDVTQSRNPFDEQEEDGKFRDVASYMRPWLTPLSKQFNEGAVIYDSHKHRIWIIDQESWSSVDPALRNVSSGSNTGRHSLESIPSRPAGDVLRDINHWYRTLEELPGSGTIGNEWEDKRMDLRNLYRKHGWPDSFDGDAFQIDQTRKDASIWAKNLAERPLKKVQHLSSWREYLDKTIETLKQKIIEAENENEEWATRVEVWKFETTKLDCLAQLDQALEVADQYCPNNVCQKQDELPLWEVEWLKGTSAQIQRNLASRRKVLDEVKGIPEEEHTYGIWLHQEEKQALVYQRAYEESKSDAERLCPGKTLEPPRDMRYPSGVGYPGLLHEHDENIARFQKWIEEGKELELKIPKLAKQARYALKSELHSLKRKIEREQEDRIKEEKWLAGNE